jgi:hypothetical protein
MGYRAVAAARALLETAGSFHSFDVLRDALGGDERKAMESSWHCKRLVSMMAQYEKDLTHRLLRDGAVFRLQADGLDRTYQVEIGTVIWSLSSDLEHVLTHGERARWLEVLGPRGPCIVERIIGMQGFPQRMDCDGNVSMLEAATKAIAKRAETVAQSLTQPLQSRDEHLAPVRTPGIMLVRLQDEEAGRKAQQLRLQLTSDPLDLVTNVVQVPVSTRNGHVVVLAPLVDTVCFR